MILVVVVIIIIIIISLTFCRAMVVGHNLCVHVRVCIIISEFSRYIQIHIRTYVCVPPLSALFFSHTPLQIHVVLIIKTPLIKLRWIFTTTCLSAIICNPKKQSS